MSSTNIMCMINFKKLTNEDLSYIEAILDYFKLKSLEN